MDHYMQSKKSAIFHLLSFLVLMSCLLLQVPLTAGEVPLKDFIIDHLKSSSVYRGGGVGSPQKTASLHPIPSQLQHQQNLRKGEPNSLTPGQDRVFFPPYKFPFWGLPYGIYSKGGFFNPGLFPFVPGGPGFPPYDGIFGGPFGPGKFPGPGPTPFQGGSDATQSGNNDYYHSTEAPKRYKKKKYKKKCCYTTTLPPPPETTTTPPPPPPTYPPYENHMDDYRSYRGSPPRKYPPPPSYSRYTPPPSYNPYQYHGYAPPPNPPPYQNPYGQMPYPLIIQTPIMMPASQPQPYITPQHFNPYGGQSQFGYPSNPYAPPLSGNPPITVHNFYASPHQGLPFPYYPQPLPPEYPTSITTPPPEYSTTTTPPLPTPYTTTPPPTTTPYTTTTQPPTTYSTTTQPYTTPPPPVIHYIYATQPPPTTSPPPPPIMHYSYVTPPPYTTPPPTTTQGYSYRASQEAYSSYWYSTPPSTSATTKPPNKTYYTSYGSVDFNTESYPSSAQYRGEDKYPPRRLRSKKASQPPRGSPSRTTPIPSMQTLVDISNPLSTPNSATDDVYEDELYGDDAEPEVEIEQKESPDASMSSRVTYSVSRGRRYS